MLSVKQCTQTDDQSITRPGQTVQNLTEASLAAQFI
jgi:hypothetical protein